MYKIQHLLERSKHGLKIGESAAKKVSASMKRIEINGGAEKVLLLLNILQLLSETEHLEDLCSEGFYQFYQLY